MVDMALQQGRHGLEDDSRVFLSLYNRCDVEVHGRNFLLIPTDAVADNLDQPAERAMLSSLRLQTVEYCWCVHDGSGSVGRPVQNTISRSDRDTCTAGSPRTKSAIMLVIVLARIQLGTTSTGPMSSVTFRHFSIVDNLQHSLHYAPTLHPSSIPSPFPFPLTENDTLGHLHRPQTLLLQHHLRPPLGTNHHL